MCHGLQMLDVHVHLFLVDSDQLQPHDHMLFMLTAKLELALQDS